MPRDTTGGFRCSRFAGGRAPRRSSFNQPPWGPMADPYSQPAATEQGKTLKYSCKYCGGDGVPNVPSRPYLLHSKCLVRAPEALDHVLADTS